MKKPYYVRVETHPENPDIIRMSAVPAEFYYDDLNRIGAARAFNFIAFAAKPNSSPQAYVAQFRTALGDLLAKVDKDGPDNWRWVPGAFCASDDAMIPVPVQPDA